MAQEAEEKRLPASAKKLTDARRKGQVPQSRDVIAGFTLCGALGFLFYYWPTLFENVFQLVRTVADSSTRPFDQTVQLAIGHASDVVLALVVPMVLVIVVIAIVFGMFAAGGPVFSFDPLVLRAEHINPGSGFKRIFSLRNAVEFLKALAKTTILCALLVALPLIWLQSVLVAPGCGERCLAPTIASIVVPLAAAAALAFIVIGLIDLPIQRGLFLRDMRMTRSESKREFRDMEGDPQVQQEFVRQRREAVSRPLRVGIRNANLVIVAGDRLLGLRYVAGETPVPVVVAKGQGRAAAELRTEAVRSVGAHIAEDTPLVDMLYGRARVGSYVPPESFQLVIRHLAQSGLV